MRGRDYGGHGNDWTNWEADRRALTPKFANAKAAPRYALSTNKA